MRAAVSASAAAIIVTFAPVARADFSDKAYEDIKDLVEDLITADVAESVVPNVVCRAPEIVNYYPRSLQRVFDRQFGSLRSSLQDETSALVAYQVLVSTNPRYAAGRKRPANQTLLVSGAKGGSAASSAAPATPARASCELERIQQLAGKSLSTCRKHVESCFRARHYATLDAQALTEACGAPEQLPPAERLSCALALGAQGSLQGKLDAVEVQLFQAVGVLVTDAAGEALNVPPAVRSRAMAGVTLLVRDMISSTDKPDTAAFVAVLGKELGVDTTPGSVNAPKLAAVADAVQRLKLQWGAISSKSVKIDLPTFVRALSGTGTALVALCTPTTPGTPPTHACSVLLDLNQTFSTGGVAYPMFRAMERRDYREIAMLAIRDLFDRVAAPSPEDKELFKLYRQFTESVAVYVLDAVGDGEPSVGSRAAFKTAAFDVVRQAASGESSGFDRPFGWKIIVPEFALRYTYSSSFINQASGDGFRFSPTVEWLTFRKRVAYTDRIYLAVQGSLADLAGPFSETALRRNEDYRLGPRVWGQFLRPRAEVVFGVPALSNKLAVTLGLSLRATTPLANIPASAAPPTAPAAPVVYEYRWFFEPSEGSYTADIGKFTELSIALKYVP